ncbi:hypothetical protein SLA2020_045540 [Shorea laevis]
MDASQPSRHPSTSTFDPQRRVEVTQPIDTVPSEIAATPDESHASSSTDNDIQAAPRKKKGRGKAKPLKMPTDGSKIPLVLDSTGNIPQNI